MTREREPDRWLFYAYLALIAWVPVPLGSNRAWSWALMECWIFLIAFAWMVGLARGRHVPGPVLARTKWMLWLFGGWVGFVWLQLLPLPLPVLGLVSPEAAKWHLAAALGQPTAWAPLTLDRFGTLEGALKSTAYCVFFAMTLVLVKDRERVKVLTYVLISSGIAQALYAVAVSLPGPGAGVTTGTFVNRNHFAAYLVMCLSTGIGVLIASLSGERCASWREFLRGAIEWLITPKMALRLLLLAMVIALVLTRSRMGNAAFFLSLLGAGLLGLAFSKRATRSTVILLASLVVIDLLVVGTFFGTQRIVEHIGQTALETEDRDEVARYALTMWKDYPVFGAGLGAFPSAFPRYSAQGTVQAYTHAHNDYVELAAETGAIGITLLGLVVTLSFAAAVRAQQLRRDPVMRGISFAAMMAMIALMIHSLADFNLQIPANALTFVLMLALAWIARHCEGGE